MSFLVFLTMISNKIIMSSKVICVKSNVRNKSVYQVLKIPYNFLNIFALSCVRRGPGGVLEPYFSPVKIALTWMVITAVCSVGFYNRFLYSYTGLILTVKATDIFQTLSDLIQYTLDIFCTYYYGRLYALEYINRYESIDQTLNFKEYNLNKRFMIRLTAFLTIFWAMVCSIDFCGWFSIYDVLTTLIWSPAYICKLIKVLVILEITAHVKILSSRLERIADTLHRTYGGLATLQSMTVDPLASPYCLGNKPYFDRQDRGPVGRAAENVERVRQLTRCYVLLVEQSQYINCAFGLRILLMFINVMTDMIRWINVGLFILFGILKNVNDIALPVLGCFAHFALGAGLLLCLVLHCEQSYRQRGRILRLLTHTLLNKALGVEYRAAVEELRDVITTRALRWTAFDVFPLDYKMLQGFVSAIVTYTIILTQMGGSK